MPSRLDGQRAMVVGASSGIGRAIAEAYVDEGARVAIASRSTDVLEDLAAKMDEETVPIECDVQETTSVESAVDAAVDALGGLDVAVNSAGVIARGNLLETDNEDMEWMVDVNLKGMMRVAKAVLPELVATEGTFIPVSSQLGEVGVEGASVYCSTKGGINNLTRQLAVEHAEDGVRVNALAPGVVKTEMNEDVRESNEEWEKDKRALIPLNRLADSGEIADPAVFLASDASSYMTGHVLVVDGGYIVQ